MSRECNSGGLE